MRHQVLGSYLFGSGDSRSKLSASLLARRFRSELLTSVFLEGELVGKCVEPYLVLGHTMMEVERNGCVVSHLACSSPYPLPLYLNQEATTK